MMNFHDQNRSSDWFSRVILSESEESVSIAPEILRCAQNDTAWSTFRLW